MASYSKDTSFWACVNRLGIKPNEHCFQRVPRTDIQGVLQAHNVCRKEIEVIPGSKGRGIRMEQRVALHQQLAPRGNDAHAFLGYWDGVTSPRHELRLLDFQTLTFSITDGSGNERCQ